ncbi:MAG: molybdopterin cofactor-binding domain-containing protein [Vicinamibacterales bacterium]
MFTTRQQVLEASRHGRYVLTGDDGTLDVAARGLDRRAFLRVSLAASGGLLVALHWSRVDASTLEGQAPDVAAFQPSAYIRIDPDDTVTLWSAQPDMGEGTKTTLPMLLADELDADWSRVRIELAPLDQEKYRGQGSGGSDAVRYDWDHLRKLGATARWLLVQAAAAEWGVAAEACETAAGVVRGRGGHEATYGALATRAARLPVPEGDVPMKNPSRYTIIGTRVPNVDNGAIVRGERLFGLDVKLPGMKYAAIAKAPVFDGRPLRVDDTAARAVPGVLDVVQVHGLDNPTFMMSGVAVVADSTWAAFKGREALRVEWSEGRHATESSETLTAQFRELLETPVDTLHDSGSVETALAAAAHTVDATFEYGFVSHATLEPHNCTAEFRDGECYIRGPLQMPGSGRQVVAAALGIPPERVHVQSTRIGGGFGRRLMSDFAAEAAVISRATGRPIQVVETREGDLAHDYYRGAGMQRLRAGADASGRVTAWDHTIVSVSRNAYRRDPRPAWSTEMYGSYIGRVDTLEQTEPDLQPTRIPNARLRYGQPTSGVPVGAWRAPSHVANAFVIESVIDELATAAGRSAVDMRLDFLGEPGDMPANPANPSPYDPARMKRVILAAADRGGYGRRPAEGRAIGFASHHTFGSYCAQVAEVSVDARKRVTIHRLLIVLDVGQPVNLSGLEAQAQGGAIDGIGTAFFADVPIADGRAATRNFDRYRLIRHREIPRVIEVVILPSTTRPTGFGEIPVPPAAPALANAVAALTGERLRVMPFARAGYSL